MRAKVDVGVGRRWGMSVEGESSSWKCVVEGGACGSA